MKKDKKDLAIKLRQEGKSINKIAFEIGVSKSSVSVWVRDVVLSKEQMQNLQMPRGKDTKVFKEDRRKFQSEGMLKSKERDINHAIGCMLYWAEGSKTRNQVAFANSDPEMHKTFLRFLKTYFGITNENVAINVNCYLDHGLDIEEIYRYWIDELDLNGCRVNKATIRDPTRSSFTKGRKKSKLKHGVMTIRVSESRIIQHIYGAIQGYCGFVNNNWIEK